MSRSTKLRHLAYAWGCYSAGVAGLAVCVVFLLGLSAAPDVGSNDAPWWPAALAVDLALVTGWGLQHSVMARPAFKRWWTTKIPPHTERATYCLASGLALAAVCLAWQPLPGTLWHVSASPLRDVLSFGGLSGWVFLLAATFEIDHGELFGLKQAYRGVRNGAAPAASFQARYLYRIVRHPIQLGVLIGMWVTPTMTATRFAFATTMTVYILVGLYFEERALLREFGRAYADYRRRVPMLVPFLR